MSFVKSLVKHPFGTGWAGNTRTAVVTAAALCVFAPAGAHAETPVPANFEPQYQPPAGPLPPHNGDLIFPSANLFQPMTVGPLDPSGNYVNFSNAKDFHLVMYRTTSARGEPIAATGMLIRSKANLANYPVGSVRPLVAYAPGNQGVADDCASSFVARSGAWYENFPVNGILSKGFDVVVPDYEGLGVTDGRVHPVANNRSNGQATLDALKAAENAMPQLLPVASPVPLRMAVWGYSEGGGAAAWVASHIAYAAPSVVSKIAAVAAGGATAGLEVIGQVANGQDQASRSPVDFAGHPLVNRFSIPAQDIDGNGVLDNAEVNPYSALILMAASAMQAVYKPTIAGEAPFDHSQFDLTTKFGPTGLGDIEKVQNKCLVDGLAVAPGAHVKSFVINPDPDTSAGYTDASGKLVYPSPTATAWNPLTNTVWSAKFDEINPAYVSAGSSSLAVPTVPTYLYHGSKDVSVAYPQGVELRERWCSVPLGSRAPIFWRRFNALEHVQTWGYWASALGFVQQLIYQADGRPNGASAYGDNCSSAP